ncbi:MAG: RIP metalloprotease RseP [Simkaniaceae bacterium]|nr:RIP metalloprotease RseP [Candidatus Sacchlamyda saccharinae]
MLINIIYILLALLGMGFLIFIHELGHYFMARREGIKVEAFAIGFGKPIVEWERDGVKWKICWLPFGGYVKMAGMEKQGPIEPYQIEDGFFGKKPWSRIKVAAMGPIVNIVFAFFAFSLIWISGGRDKPFAEFTHHIGWVDKDSNLYKQEIRAGDSIDELNGRPFKSFNDFISSSVLDNQNLIINGYEIDYWSGKRSPFTYTFDQAKNLDGLDKARQIGSQITPARYLIFDKFEEGSPMSKSGIEKGDRILWVDGELVFSYIQLVGLLNQNSILLTVDRDGQTIHTRIPLVQIRDLRLDSSAKAELDDWREEAGLNSRIEELHHIPYKISSTGVVKSPAGYIDDRSRSKDKFTPKERSSTALMRGDRVLAVSGKPISSGHELLKHIQERASVIIVKRGAGTTLPSYKEADKDFVTSFDIPELKKILETIGTDNPTTSMGDLHLLASVKSLPMSEFPLSAAQRDQHEEKVEKQRKAIEEMSDPQQKEEANRYLDFYQNRRTLGLYLEDKQVAYNPPPTTLFSDVFKEISRTLFALVTGFLSPKHMAGPVGIIQVIQQGWSLGFNEALYWLGMISLNLGLLNLLPIPVLDGGHITLSLWEMITKKPLKAKTMERLIFPFVVLLIVLIVFLTYNDIVRIIKNLF